MKTRNLILLALVMVGVSACSDKSAEIENARRDAEAKARAEAAKKEMDALPKTFKNPDYFKKNEPKSPEPKPTSESEKKTVSEN